MEEFRLQYPLSESSLVLDAGAYRGDFISWCRDRWRCDVLFKINIEGGEYSLLKRMLDTGLVARVRYFQVQYHGIGAGPEGPAVARGRIRARLSETHKEEWCVNGGQWESWARR